MNVLFGFLIVFLAAAGTGYAIYRRRWRWIVWTAIGGIVVGGGFYLVKNFPNTDSSSSVPPRQLRGIYELPASGAATCQTIRKEELVFQTGEPVRFEQLEGLAEAEFEVINDNIPFLTIRERSYTTGPALTGGKLCLRASGGKKVLVRATILD
jgi:hypothetical protein